MRAQKKKRKRYRTQAFSGIDAATGSCETPTASLSIHPADAQATPLFSVQPEPVKRPAGGIGVTIAAASSQPSPFQFRGDDPTCDKLARMHCRLPRDFNQHRSRSKKYLRILSVAPKKAERVEKVKFLEEGVADEVDLSVKYRFPARGSSNMRVLS